MKNWYRHYLQRGFYPGDIGIDPFGDFVLGNLGRGAKVLECGCGLGRTAATIRAQSAATVLAIDIDHRLLALAADIHEEEILSGGLAFAALDLRHVARFFKPGAFDACSHAGVLEHFGKSDRGTVLRQQLRVAPNVLMSIPLGTQANREYFAQGPDAWREMQSFEDWSAELAASFELVVAERSTHRTENGFFFIRSQDADL